MQRRWENTGKHLHMDTQPSANSGLVIVPGTWGHKKTKLRNRFKQLSDADLFYQPGQEAELTQRLCERLGLSIAEVERIVHAI
ncbi:MAG: hypothetical protein IPM46_07425 [Flavobacteriales bacterium]|nr:hypothetical protein [Flavobacteriales bacterium]